MTDIKIIQDVGSAVKHAVETASPQDAVCIAGSLYVVGEAKEELEKNYHSLLETATHFHT